MKSWMQRLVAWAAPRRDRSAPTPANRRAARLGLEGLERREVLSAAATPVFTALGTIATSGQPATVDFVLASGSLTAPKNGSSVILGIDPTPAPLSYEIPVVTGVVSPDGQAVRPSNGSAGAPFLARVAVPSGANATYSATVTAPRGGTGGFVLKGFLAGDVNGDLRVDGADLRRIAAAYAARVGDARYDAAADVNQDGRVGELDRSYAAQNQGAAFTAITPPPAPAVATQAPAPVVAPAAVPATPVVVATPVVAPIVTPVVTPVATPVAAPAVAPAPAAAPNVVWIPVVMNPGATTTTNTPGGLTWSPQYSAYYPTQVGAAVPSGPTFAAPSYSASPTYAAPPGGYYYAVPGSAAQGVPVAQAGQVPVYYAPVTR